MKIVRAAENLLLGKKVKGKFPSLLGWKNHRTRSEQLNFRIRLQMNLDKFGLNLKGWIT